MVILVVVTALVSAALDNVTTVLLVAPVTFLVCQGLTVPAALSGGLVLLALSRLDWLRQACPELVDSTWISLRSGTRQPSPSGGGAAGVVCVAGVPGRLVGSRWTAPGMVVHGFQG